MSERAAAEPSASVRLDVWLWAARFFKTRALAKQVVEGGKVETAAGDGCKPARAVRVGDRFRVRRGDELFDIEVLGLAEKRGSAAVAQQLYVEEPTSVARRAAEREQRRLEAAGFSGPVGRPSKKDRRQIRALPGGKAAKLPPWWPES
jgi:ribosome-associated heat shock protein Hsp15